MSKTKTQTNIPVEAPGFLNRRTFVRVALGGVALGYAGAIGYPVYRYLKSPVERAAAETAITEVTLADAQKLAPGSGLMFRFGSRPSLLIHHKDGSWLALSAVCTHLGCTVQYLPDQNRIHCACHGGEYDPATGKNIGGPPPRPLTKYLVKVTEANVVVSRG